MLAMIIVIIAGGSGTRLWPLSTPDYPKHLLKINGEQISLVQKTYQRAKKVASEVYVITEAGHAHHVKEQIPELDEEHCIIEPARRGTASCIIAALVYLSTRHDSDEVIASIHADHYIRDVDGFAHSFRVAEQSSKTHGKIVLVGVEPDHPSTGFGYIQKDGVVDEDQFVYSVKGFKEKPDYETAQQYLESGNYLWNGGYFVGSINTFKNAMRDYAPDLLENYEKLVKSGEKFHDVYLSFENEPIDIALIEKVHNLLMVPASFDWMDLGSFGDLHKAAGSNEEGNYVAGDVEVEGVENSFIQNDENKPVAVIGLDNIVVINTENGILVARKDLAQKVGEVSKRISKRDA